MRRDTKIIMCACGVKAVNDKLTEDEENKYNTDKMFSMAFKCPICNNRWIIQCAKNDDDKEW